MGLLVNQINVLLQRVKMAGRTPHKLLMHQGLKEALKTELNHMGLRQRFRYNVVIDQAVDQPRAHDRISFMGIPVVVDNSITEILVQVKPRPYGEDEPIPNIDWSKIRKVERL